MQPSLLQLCVYGHSVKIDALVFVRWVALIAATLMLLPLQFATIL